PYEHRYPCGNVCYMLVSLTYRGLAMRASIFLCLALFIGAVSAQGTAQPGDALQGAAYDEILDRTTKELEALTRARYSYPSAYRENPPSFWDPYIETLVSTMVAVVPLAFLAWLFTAKPWTKTWREETRSRWARRRAALGTRKGRAFIAGTLVW